MKGIRNGSIEGRQSCCSDSPMARTLCHLLEVSSLECRVAGTMPVATGMHLRVWISPTNRNDTLYVKEARVVWTRQNEFGLEMVDVDADDRRWLTRFFERG